MKNRFANRIFETMKKHLSKIILFILPLFVAAMVVASDKVVEKSAKKQEQKVTSNVWVEEQLNTMTLKEKIGQFFMVAAYSKKDESHFAEIDAHITKDKVGGIIFFQGNRTNLVSCIDRFQGKAKVPLLIGMDAEWGVQMRLSGEERFPYNYTLGAANDPVLTERIAEMMGQECRELGIHINFAPVADVNSNPNNPVIGFRSYGENPKDVAAHVEATVKGMEGQGVLTSIKHFPGHGDTDVDSHLDLPIVNNSFEHINAIDFFPFRSGIRAGASSVMIGHLNVPALDPSGTPSSLSAMTIKKYLQQDLGFKGLVISDALGMKAVADRYGKTDVVVKAFQAGCDILLFPESVTEAIQAIQDKVEKGEISMDEIDNRCRKVLLAKHKAIITPKKVKKYNSFEIELAKNQVYEKAVTVIKNEEELLPFKRFDQRILHVSIGEGEAPFNASMDLVAPIRHVKFNDATEAIAALGDSLQNFDVVITSFHASSVLSKNDYGMPKKWRDWVKQLPASAKNVLVLFGNPFVLAKNEDLARFQSIVIGYENHPLAMNRVGQFMMGTYESSGTLPMMIDRTWNRGIGIKVPSAGRLKESQPEELGISREKLQEIDAIVERSIKEGVFPGCQIVVAVEGNVIYRKSFGHHTYDAKRAVQNTDVYDIASITKVAASTLSLMRLESQGEFSLDSKLSDYIPEVVEGTSYANIRLKNMMAHQAGLKPWIPFYTKTLTEGNLSKQIYATERTDEFDTQVAENVWIKSGYSDQIYKDILQTSMIEQKYKYSDVGYYFIKKIVEKKTGKSLDEYVFDEFYAPMGLNYMRYHPLNYFPKEQITPTENDQIYRKQLIHGFVHDQGAAMMGGVGGHAGLFSNASDLAQLMQLFLNKGSFGGESYLKPSVVDAYTACQFCPSNRRGAGFDKPTTNRVGGPASSQVSLSSFGHAGFTGTLAWADPEYKVNFVFLSNRVYPDAENWKIVKLNVRTEIQDVIYQAVKARKK